MPKSKKKGKNSKIKKFDSEAEKAYKKNILIKIGKYFVNPRNNLGSRHGLNSHSREELKKIEKIFLPSLQKEEKIENRKFYSSLAEMNFGAKNGFDINSVRINPFEDDTVKMKKYKEFMNLKLSDKLSQNVDLGSSNKSKRNTSMYSSALNVPKLDSLNVTE